MLGEKKEYKDAIAQFDRAIEIYDRESAQAYHNRAWAYELNGEVDKAIPDYEEALHRNPYQVISGEKLGFIYYKRGDYENAIRVGEVVLKHDPENSEVTKWLPDAYTKRIQVQKKVEQDRKKKEEEERIRKEAQEKLTNDSKDTNEKIDDKGKIETKPERENSASDLVSAAAERDHAGLCRPSLHRGEY